MFCRQAQGRHYISRLKFKVNSRFLPTFYPEFKVFVHFSRFYKLSNIAIITIFFSHDRLSQRYTSTSTLSKMNFIQLYHNARDTHTSTKRLYSRSKCPRDCSNSHTVFSFFSSILQVRRCYRKSRQTLILICIDHPCFNSFS